MKQSFIRQAVTRWVGADRAMPVVGDPESAAAFFRTLIEDESKEHFMSLFLSTRHRYLGYQIISIGSLSQSLVHPREVFSVAVRECASAIVIAHNHPSGDPQPSREDHEVTKRMVAAGKVLGISVLDHLVLGIAGFESFKRLGVLQTIGEEGDLVST